VIGFALEVFGEFMRLWRKRPQTVEIAVAAKGAEHRRSVAKPLWSDLDDSDEETSFLANPTAFWLRPDRHKHSVPCWAIDEPYCPSISQKGERGAEAVHFIEGRKKVKTPGGSVWVYYTQSTTTTAQWLDT
jgi:hypothetical protein